jgi:hypothetical protein
VGYDATPDQPSFIPEKARARDMREVPYYPTRLALYLPHVGPTVFTPGQAVSDALLAAECARLVYKKFDSYPDAKEEVIAALATVGYGNATFFSTDGTDAFAAVHASSSEVVVAFRGTERDPRDYATDVRAWKVAWRAGGSVHAGFAAAFESIWPPLRAWVARHAGRRLFTGHSLGGALATLAASLSGPSRLMTFGCPRVGDAAFVRTLAATEVTRYVDCCDMVCRVPPERFGFVHPDATMYIDRNGVVKDYRAGAETRSDQRRARGEYLLRYAWKKGNVLLRELADHAPLNYVAPLLAASSKRPLTDPG